MSYVQRPLLFQSTLLLFWERARRFGLLIAWLSFFAWSAGGVAINLKAEAAPDFPEGDTYFQMQIVIVFFATLFMSLLATAFYINPFGIARCWPKLIRFLHSRGVSELPLRQVVMSLPVLCALCSNVLAISVYFLT